MVYLSGDLSQTFAMVEREPTVELRDHPVPVDKNIKGDDRRDDQQRQEIEQRGSAGHQPCESVEKPLCALRDEVADRLLNLRARQLLAEPEGVQPPAAIFRNERVSLLHGERLQPHRVAWQMLSEGDELISQHRDDKNKKEDTGQDENSENEKRRAEAIEPKPLKFEHDGIKKIAENNAGGEWRYCRAEQIDDKQEGRHSEPPEEDLALQAHSPNLMAFRQLRWLAAANPISRPRDRQRPQLAHKPRGVAFPRN